MSCTLPTAAVAERHVSHPHGAVDTPAFMPVGTQGAVKGLTSGHGPLDRPRWCSPILTISPIRPGETVVRDLGGLHQFMGWDGPILTDSGGFQLFSLAENTKITEQGRSFVRISMAANSTSRPKRHPDPRSTRQRCGDGARSRPQIAERAAPDPRGLRRGAAGRPAVKRRPRARSGPVRHCARRTRCRLAAMVRLAELVKLNFPGYAIGGLSVGERRPRCIAFSTLPVRSCRPIARAIQWELGGRGTCWKGFAGASTCLTA